MLEVTCGAIIAVLIAVGVEYLRRPNLKLLIEAPPQDIQYPAGSRPARDVRYLRLKLFNKPLPGWARWMVRAPALQCRGTITFHHLDGQNVFGRAMPVRWSGSPQPIPIQAFMRDGIEIQIFDPMRISIESRIDVYPGESESELLDVAARLDSDPECYGWNNESYLCPTPWRNLAWKLVPGRYLVRVVVRSSGQKCVALFRLINDVSRGDCRLELALPGDKAV
jgi:hypothetical protein